MNPQSSKRSWIIGLLVAIVALLVILAVVLTQQNRTMRENMLATQDLSPAEPLNQTNTPPSTTPPVTQPAGYHLDSETGISFVAPVGWKIDTFKGTGQNYFISIDPTKNLPDLTQPLDYAVYSYGTFQIVRGEPRSEYINSLPKTYMIGKDNVPARMRTGLVDGDDQMPIDGSKFISYYTDKYRITYVSTQPTNAELSQFNQFVSSLDNL
jgi:hypothetical protein